MNLYIAGLYTSHFGLHSNLFRKTPPPAQELRRAVGLKLESYHYIKKGKYVESIRRDQERVFLDSGAFSSFSLGVDVDIGEYAEFIKEHEDIIEMASVLDAIGDHEQTYRNQKELERRGCFVLPCYHYGEPFELGRFYAENYPYMTVGGMVPIPNQKLEPWLDEVWEKALTDSDGLPLTKVHGFGLTSRPLMEKYPWYSVDSSSWVQAASNGNIVLPEVRKIIPISDRSPAKKKFGQHYISMPPMMQEYISKLLNYYGLTVEDVAHEYRCRWSLNAFSFDRIGRALGDDHWRRPFKSPTMTLF